MKLLISILGVVVVSLLFQCSNYTDESAGTRLTSENSKNFPGQLMKDPPSREIVSIGKLLFWDPVLSGSKDVACATCHHPDFGYAENLDLSIGAGGTGLGFQRKMSDRSKGGNTRNSQSIVNTAFNGLLSYDQELDPGMSIMFWDGRAHSLEDQVYLPITSPDEMMGNNHVKKEMIDTLLQRLNKITEYKSLFKKAYPGMADAISWENVSTAIASFERTIVSVNSPYDKYLKGDDKALTRRQLEGLKLFFGKAGCGSCHSGPMFSDFNFYNIGVPDNPKSKIADEGVQRTGAFRTPTLRNLAYTAPYMHNGSIKTLYEVIDHYNKGEKRDSHPGLISYKIKPLNLSTNEMNKIIEFLLALTDDSYDKAIPESVPSGLKPGGNI